MLIAADDDLLVGAADLDDIERRSRGHAESLALADGKVVNAGMLADHVAVCGDEVAGGVGQGSTLLGEVGVDETLVVAAGNETDLLGVGLLCEREAVLAGQFANLGLGHIAERKRRPAELFLREAEEEIRLILAGVGGTLQQPAATASVERNAGVVACRHALCADLLRDDQELIELQMIVAEAAGDGRTSRKILFDERAYDVPLESLLVVDDVVGDADLLGDAARVVDIVDGTAASLHRLGHAIFSGQAALVPELHGQADNVVTPARSMAATVEESTPPDMATAMVSLLRFLLLALSF